MWRLLFTSFILPCIIIEAGPSKCGPNSEISNCARNHLCGGVGPLPYCLLDCQCKEGWMYNEETKECVLPIHCPKNVSSTPPDSQTKPKCNEDNHEEFSLCTNCLSTCSTQVDKRPNVEKPGCACKFGFILDDSTNICITAEEAKTKCKPVESKQGEDKSVPEEGLASFVNKHVGIFKEGQHDDKNDTNVPGQNETSKEEGKPNLHLETTSSSPPQAENITENINHQSSNSTISPIPDITSSISPEDSNNTIPNSKTNDSTPTQSHLGQLLTTISPDNSASPISENIIKSSNETKISGEENNSTKSEKEGNLIENSPSKGDKNDSTLLVHEVTTLGSSITTLDPEFAKSTETTLTPNALPNKENNITTTPTIETTTDESVSKDEGTTASLEEGDEETSDQSEGDVENEENLEEGDENLNRKRRAIVSIFNKKLKEMKYKINELDFMVNKDNVLLHLSDH